MKSITFGSAGSGAALALGATLSAQVGGAVSVAVLDQIEVLQLTWLRLVLASLILVVLVRPWRHSFSRSGLMMCLLLGVTSGLMTLFYMGAITLLPLGTTTALQFLGPLGIAILHASGAAKLWALVPALGVLALTEPWQGDADLWGILLALASGLFWALYIILTQRAGDEIDGLNALAASVPVAAVVATFATGLSSISRITMDMVLLGLVVAILLSLTPYVLELLALRRLTAQAFGVLMSLQPAVAVIVGWALLGQVPRPLALLGISLVVVAGIGATRTGARTGQLADTGAKG